MRQLFQNIWKSRYLIKIWTQYNIQGTYIDNKLGLLWILIQPIALTLIYTVVFSGLLNRKPRGDIPFVIFFLSGMVVWQFINNSIRNSPMIIIKNLGLISQVKFSREVFIIVSLCENLVDFFATSLVLIAIASWFGYYPNLNYLLLPLVVLVGIIFTSGIMFLLATLGVFVRDIGQLTGLILRFVFYLSGIIFTPDMLPEGVLWVINLNPIYLLISSFRNIILYNSPPDYISLGVITLLGWIFLMIGYATFRMREGSFADYK